MQLQTILNRVGRYKSFVYRRAEFDERAVQSTLLVELDHRKNSRPLCSVCKQPRPGYDRLPARRWRHVPLWQIVVFFVYAPRRVNCPDCGVVVEHVPWSFGKRRQTKPFICFLAAWAKRLSWETTAEVFGASWSTVYRCVREVVLWGQIHQDVSQVTAIGVDEIQWKRGHQYLTLVYQIDAGARRLLWIGVDRTEKTLHAFFDLLGAQIAPSLRYVCSDMWRPYLNVIRERAGEAVHVLDRYHIMATMNKAIDEIRAGEARRMRQDGYEPLLKHSRWVLLKRVANLSAKQVVKLRDLLQYNLRTMRAWLLREDFQRFWEYRSPFWARQFLRQWCTRTMRSRLEPMKKVARSLREHEPLLINWFHAHGEISAGIVEGLNNKAKLTMRKAYGFRTREVIETALYHQLGNLPEPPSPHRFW